MELKPGNEAIYRQKHDEIWPEMVETLHRFGIRNYSIFRRGLTLFAYLECDDRRVWPASRRPGRAALVADDAAVHGLQRRRDALERAD